MKFEPTQYTIKRLVEAYKSGSLARNDEYQRGATWRPEQQQALVDSVFREYPLPSFFFEVKTKPGLEGDDTKLYEVIDGQQRILSLVDYLADDFALLAPHDPKLRLPMSLRQIDAPWGGKRFSELSEGLKKKLLDHTIHAYLVQEVENSDEVRDLFIRLQSGTALTRQQIRDAWPGELGPRVERWAGKLKKQPKYEFFTVVDGRGMRDDEDDSSDPWVKHRTSCAQLCALLLARAENPFATPSIKAGDLDALYHKNTKLDSANNPLDHIEAIFDQIEDIVARIKSAHAGRRKAAKITLFALAMLLQDLQRAGSFKLTTESKNALAEATRDPSVTQNSRASSGGVIRDYYERWRSSLPVGIGVELDSKRLFDDTDKVMIRAATSGTCALCGEAVLSADEEFDHFPVPYRDGGRTEPANGRLVHRECHPRGRPVSN